MFQFKAICHRRLQHEKETFIPTFQAHLIRKSYQKKNVADKRKVYANRIRKGHVDIHIIVIDKTFLNESLKFLRHERENFISKHLSLSVTLFLCLESIAPEEEKKVSFTFWRIFFISSFPLRHFNFNLKKTARSLRNTK